jgi:hypothetical protein
MRNSVTMSVIASVGIAASAFATITPTTLFGDSYLVTDGARTLAVLDVYIKGSSQADIVSSTFGVSAYVSAFSLNNGNSFEQSNGDGSNNSWKPAAGTTAWDSFVTCGNRDQASAASTLQLQLDSNWAAGNGSAIAGTVGGPGWYPAVGASTSTNPYARIGFYNNDTSGINTAKTASNIAGNGVTVGQNLNNHWMIGRFTIDVTGDSATNNQMTLKFAIAGKQNGTTTFTGATSTAGRFQSTLTFASIPAPGAAALVGLAGLIARRRQRG